MRKKRNRRETQKRKRLKEKNQRIESREEKRYVGEEISLFALLKKYSVEVLLIAIVIAGITLILSFGPDQRATQKLQKSFNSFLYAESSKWDKLFSQGYKVFVFTEEGIIPTSFDTLPDDLEINWKKISVTRVQANQLSGTTEKIKITISNIAYAPANVSGRTVTTTLMRQKGASAQLTRLGKFELMATIVEDDGSQLYCLLGLKNL